MKNFIQPLLSTVFIAVISIFSSVSLASGDKYDNLRAMIAKTFPGLEISGFKESAVGGILEFNLGAQVFYASQDGRFLFKGNIYDLVTQENITEKAEQVSRVSTLKKFGEKNMLNYTAENQQRYITVFTDVDCPYCRKLHEEVPEYLEKGIGVRYMFLPFKGKKSFDKSVSIWCAKDPQKAMDDAKQGRRIRNAECDHPIKDHMALGQEFGIRGTPAIILDNGEVIPGYRPVKDVAKVLSGVK